MSAKPTTRRGRPPKKMATVTMTDEQFARLLQQIQVQPAVTEANNVAVEKKGSFVKCTSRFDGNPQDVDAFISAIEVYMNCANVSEENALKGLPMLLTNTAAVWWLGIKDSIVSWESAVAALRAAFGRKCEPYQIYLQLFAMVHEEGESTDLFVSRSRALLAGIPDPLTDKVKLDMIYGLLHRRIRKRVPRSSFKTFDELLVQSRTVEQTFIEQTPSKVKLEDEKKEASEGAKRKETPKIRCHYCKILGHRVEDCKTLEKKKRKEQHPAKPPEDKTGGLKSGSVLEPKPAITCYGCGKPGYVRANCPQCKDNVTPPSTTAQFYAVETDGTNSSNKRPFLPVCIHGHHGVVTADTGASRSIMGRTLFELIAKKCKFKPASTTLTLADGVRQKIETQVADVPITIQGKTIIVEMMVLPTDADNYTLLGIDALVLFNIVLNVAVDNWFFAENPTKVYPFVTFHKPSEEETTAHAVHDETVKLREDEATALTNEQKEHLDDVLQAHQGIFALGGDPTPYAEHRITLKPDQPPIAVPPYRLSPGKKEQLRVEINKMLEQGIIEECDSPWAAPVVLVPKKNGDVRVCVDYRKVNAITVSDSYPLPRIDDLLHEAQRTKYMSTIDLRSGYWQIQVKEQDRDITAFITPFGTYRFRRMPFGMKNAPATFSRLMDKFKTGLDGRRLLVYLDDLIVLSESFESHISDLNAVFEHLKIYKLRVNREKSHFGKEEVKYLGHIITQQGIKTDPEKIAALKNRPAPQNLKELVTILQSSAWYRRFIPNYAEVVKPLSTLTKKSVVWQWGPSQQDAYEQLMNLLTTAPILRQADTTLPYILRTDASDVAVGAALFQEENSIEKPVEYASRMLTSAERNYNTTEREALAIVWALQKFRGYVECSKIIIATDHQPLRWLMSLKTPSGRLARWSLQIQNYDLEITYTPGKSNVIADMLSRPPRTDQVELNLIIADLPRDTAEQIRTEQLEDPDLQKIIGDFEDESLTNKYMRWTDRGYIMSNGVLYHYDHEDEQEEAQLVIPQKGRHKVLQELHDAPTAGHNGVDRTLSRVRRKYYWPGLRRFVTEYVSKCIPCQKYKPTTHKPMGLLQTPAYAARMEVVSVDFFGPLPETNKKNTWILVVEDTSTRWVELFAMQTANAYDTAKILIEEVFMRYGFPRRILSDNGTQFTSAVLQQVSHVLNIKQILTSIYHPESNPTERKNRDLKPQLAILVGKNHHTWDEHLPAIRFSLNSGTCSNTGHSAAFLNFGRELRTVYEIHHDLRPILDNDNFVPLITPYLRKMNDVLLDAKETFERAQERQKKYSDEHRCPAPVYTPGDRVLLKTHQLSNADQGVTKKFMPRRDGPYNILRVLGPVTYEIADPHRPQEVLCKVHVSEITPFIEPMDDAVPTVPIIEKRRRGRPRKNPIADP